MNILLSCAGGMSSSILAEAISDEAIRNGISEFNVVPTGTESVAEDLNNNHYDLILLAPQVLYRKAYIDKLADSKNIPVMTIKGKEYNPMAAPKLFQQIMTLYKEK